MPNNPNLPPQAGTRANPQLAENASAHAPFLYFEEASAFGNLGGVIRVTLEAFRLLSRNDKEVEIDWVVVGHLRMSTTAAKSSKAALEGALLLAEPVSSESRN